MNDLYKKGVEVFGEKKFKHWLQLNNKALEGLKPIDVLENPNGINRVRDILGRIEHGVHS